jgi:uncharacterized protein
MEPLVISLAALLAAALTLFSGFGLGTLLLPVFALSFPLPAAVAATAVVHLANNLFKLALVGKDADWRVVWRFGAPAALAALAGAALFEVFAARPPLTSYSLGGRTCEITLLKVTLAVLLLGFTAYELHPRWSKRVFAPRWLAWGGVLTGFVGGLSGLQGALRSAFLLRLNLSKEAFIATGVVGAVLVDAARLTVYGAGLATGEAGNTLDGALWPLVATACVAAFAGSYTGARLLRKTTLRQVQVTVAVLLGVLALALGTGLI